MRLARICIFTGATLAASAAFGASSAPWPAFRGNLQRTGYYPEAVGYPNGRAWTATLGGEVISSPAVVDRTLYIGCRDSCLYAVSTDNGRIIWRKKTSGWVDASPLVADDAVIFGSRDSLIRAVHRTTGEALFSLRAGLQLSSPAILGNGAIVSGLGPPMKGFGAYHFRAPKWDASDAAWTLDFAQYSYSSPALFGDMAAIGANDGRVYGINATTGALVWTFQTSGGIYLSTPAVRDTTVYIAPGDADNSVYALDVRDGMFLWKSAGTPVYALPKKRAGRPIPSSWFRQLLRLSPQRRRVAVQGLERQGISVPAPWGSGLSKSLASSQAGFAPEGGIKTSSVAVDNDNVYVIQREMGVVLNPDFTVEYRQPFTLLALDNHTGKEQWRFSEIRNSPGTGYCSSPVVTTSMVFAGWGEGRLYAFDKRNGQKIWEDSLDGHIVSSPAIAGKRLYVATLNGSLCAYDLTATPEGESFARSTYCYPNPARGNVSHIQVYVTEDAALSLALYTMAEKPVLRVNRRLTAGEKFTHDWDLRNVANGVYFAFVKVKYSSGKENRKILKIAVLR